MRQVSLTVLGICLLFVTTATAEEDGWKKLFDGKTLDGWKASENKTSWSVKDGALVCDGDRSHLFYVGDDKPFTNFELECEVMTTPGSNAGIYFHTKYQETGWPKFGYECQVNVTHKDPKKSGSLYGVVNVSDPPCKDNEWYTQRIRVEGKKVTLSINGKTTVEYTEPEGQEASSGKFERRLGSGTFAPPSSRPKECRSLPQHQGKTTVRNSR